MSSAGLMQISPLALAMMSGQGQGAQGAGGANDNNMIMQMAQQMLARGNPSAQNPGGPPQQQFGGQMQPPPMPPVQAPQPPAGAPPPGTAFPLNQQPSPFRSLSAMNPQALMSQMPWRPPSGGIDPRQQMQPLTAQPY